MCSEKVSWSRIPRRVAFSEKAVRYWFDIRLRRPVPLDSGGKDDYVIHSAT